MGGSYVISISLLTFEKWPSSDKPKDYSDFIYRTPEEIAMGASGEQLNESIITDIEHMVRGLKQDPNNRWANIDVRSNDSDKETSIDITINDVDKWLENYSYTDLGRNVFDLVKKKFEKVKAPYVVISNGDDPSANTLYNKIGGYDITFALGVKSPDITTTSTTTTTTTLLPNQPVSQETSRGEIINQTQPSGQDNSGKNNITSPGITNIFKSTIKPKDIVIDTTTNEQTKNEIESGLGYIPIAWYNGIQIDADFIQFLTLYSDGMLPALKLSFIDPSGLLKDRGFPLDDTKITLFINSRSKQLKPIFAQFKIRGFSNSNGLMTIDAILDVDGLYIKKFKSYSKMSSNKALQEVCKEIGLGFNTNITDTNDTMTWINTGNRPYEFMREVIDHAYISDESFISGDIDFYYNFNYVDIQKELSRNIENEIGVVSSGLDDILSKSSTDTELSNLFLTNDASAQGNNNYFETFRIYNNSTDISLEHGYVDKIKYYDLINKSLLNFTVDSMNLNSDKSIILKGAPQDESFYKSNINYVYTGVMDVDNIHKNYNYSETHNNRNIYETQKISLEVELPTPNFNLYRFQKVKVILTSNTATPAADIINRRLTGDWIIVNIRYQFYGLAMSQFVELVKRELELSSDELDKELISTKKSSGGNRGDYENPSSNQNYTSATTSGVTASQSDCGDVTNRKNYPISKYPTYPTVFSKVDRRDVAKYINSTNYSRSVKVATFASFGIETGWGRSVINNNCNGMQTDGGLWDGAEKFIIGVTIFRENSTKKCRSFAVYKSWQSCMDHILYIMNNRMQGSGRREIVPSDPTNSDFFGKGYAKNWIGSETSYDLPTKVHKSALSFIA